MAEERGPRRTVGIDAFVKMILPFSCVCVLLWDTINEVLMESLGAFGECSIVIDGFVLAFRLTFPFRWRFPRLFLALFLALPTFCGNLFDHCPWPS